MADDGGFTRIDDTAGFKRLAAPQADTGGFTPIKPPAQAALPAATGPGRAEPFGEMKTQDAQPGFLARKGAELQDWWKSLPSAGQQAKAQTTKDIEAYQRGGTKELLKDIHADQDPIATGFAAGGIMKSVKLPPIPRGTIVEKVFSPTTVSPEAGKAEAAIRKSGGQAARSTEQTADQMEPFHRAVNAAQRAREACLHRPRRGWYRQAHG